MSNKTKSKGSTILKGMAIGLAIGATATMLVAGNKKMAKKMKTISNTMTDNVSSMMNLK
ncbi:MAG: hypothetical protein II984_04355 [Clostridia bacterium]|nr:hypothetical protein [Clostridia bacterium]